MAVYSKNEGLVVAGNAQFFRKSLIVDCPSRPVRPPVLTDTTCSINIVFRNDRKIGPGVKDYAALQPTRIVETDNPDSNGLMNRAVGNLSGNGFNAVLAIAELNETIRMLFSAAQAALRAMRLFLRGRLLDGIKALGQEKKLSRRQTAELRQKKASDVYLEGTFGWAPFASDVNSAIEALGTTFSRGMKKRRNASTSSNSKAKAKVMKRNRGYSNGMISGMVSDARVTVSGVIESPIQVWSHSLGMNPFATAWELTPFSFVVDYFFDIGGYLTALTGKAGFKNLRGCLTTTTVTKYYTSSRLEIQSIVQVTRLSRPVSASFPALDLAGATARQALNIAALVAQRAPRNR